MAGDIWTHHPRVCSQFHLNCLSEYWTCSKGHKVYNPPVLNPLVLQKWNPEVCLQCTLDYMQWQNYYGDLIDILNIEDF